MRTAAATAAIFMFFAAASVFSVRGFSFSTMARRSGWVGGLKMRADKSLANAICTPKTANQKLYNSFLKDDRAHVVICTGPAGSGKTALACHYAIEKYKQGVFKKIVITRPLVTVEEDIGFLPGTLNKKMEPWTRPMMDIFNEYYPMSVLNNMIKENIIEISPLAFMRGRTFKHSIIIADEMQNSSPNQMLMVTTRIGEGSKLIITGDLKQTDTAESGLKDLLYKYRTFAHDLRGFTDSVKLVEMANADIVRHEVVSKILDLYDAGAAPKAHPRIMPAVTDETKLPFSQVAVSEAIGEAIQRSEKELRDEAAKQILSGAPFVEVASLSPSVHGSSDCAMIPLTEYNRTRTLRRRNGNEDICGDNCFIG